MKILTMIVITLSLSILSHAQTRFRINDASKLVDVEIDVGTCSRDRFAIWCGPLTVKFFRKQRSRSFQTIRLPTTDVWDDIPKANVTRLYDDQSTINFVDVNFDGLEDVAICDGANGGYGMPSYRIYLYSRSQKRFVYSRSFTRMNEGGLGLFQTDPKKKIHYVFTKSGCCWHQMKGFDVVGNRARKIYELTEDATDFENRFVRITTGKLIKGRWRTWIKRVKFPEDAK